MTLLYQKFVKIDCYSIESRNVEFKHSLMAFTNSVYHQVVHYLLFFQNSRGTRGTSDLLGPEKISLVGTYVSFEVHIEIV